MTTAKEQPSAVVTRESIAAVVYANIFGGTSDPTLDENMQGIALSVADAILAAFPSLQQPDPVVEVTREMIAAELERLWLDGWRLDTKEGRARIAYHIEDLNAPKEIAK